MKNRKHHKAAGGSCRAGFVLERLLAKEPAQRYQTFEEFFADLKPVEETE
jgi:hypothetical protein